MKYVIKAVLLFIIFLCHTGINIHGQVEIDWTHHFGGTARDCGRSIRQTPDGGYIVVGLSESSDGDISQNNGKEDTWIIKLDAAGNLLWEKSFGGPELDGAGSVELTTDGGYVIAGHKTVVASQDFWIIKLDGTGDVMWERTYGGSGTDRATSIQPTDDGGYIVAGRSTSSDGDVSSNKGGNDYWVVKLDTNGGLQWERAYGGTAWDQVYQVQQAHDGGYILTGFSASENGDVASGNFGGTGCWVVKLDETGDLQWERNFGGSGTDSGEFIQLTNDGGYIAVAYSNSNDFDISNHKGLGDFWVIKLDAAGGLQWEKSLGGTGDEGPSEIQQTVDGGYIVSGYSTSTDLDLTNNLGKSDFWLVKLDTQGNLEWERNLGGSEAEFAFGVQSTTDSGYVMTGYTESADRDVGGNNGEQDFWVVKLKPCSVYQTMLDTILCAGDELPEPDTLKTRFGCDSIVSYRALDLPRARVGNDTSVCISDIRLEALFEPDAIGVVGVWTMVEDGPQIIDGDPSDTIINVSFLNPGENYFIWGLQHADCQEYDRDTIIVNYLVPGKAEAGEDQFVCEPTVMLDAIPPLSPFTAYWTSITNAVNFDGNSMPKVIVQGLSPDLNQFTWTITHPACPDVFRDTVDVNYLVLQEADAGTDIMDCIAEALLNAEIPPDSITGLWTSDTNLDFMDSTDPISEVFGLQEGTNRLTWTLSHPHCPNYSHDDMIIIYEHAVVTATNDEYFYEIGEQLMVNFTDNDLISDNSNIEIETFNFENEQLGILQIDDNGNLTFDIQQAEAGAMVAFSYRLTHKNCPEHTDTARVLIQLPAEMEERADFSEVFTPNGDGINDVFIIPELEERPDEFPKNSLVVINRWGDVVYEAQPYGNDWDGTHYKTGKPVPPGTYFYIARLHLADGIIRRERVTLIR